jgi:hypothetical protein
LFRPEKYHNSKNFSLYLILIILKGKSYDLINMLGDLLINILVETKFNLDFEKLTIKDYQLAGYMVATALAFFICNVQCLFGLRSIKYNLLRAYRGKSESVGKLEGNVAICNANSHFTGFLVGFLINGFLFMFSFFFAISIILYIIIEFNYWDKVGQLLLKLVSVIVVFIVKTVFNFVMSRFVFLQEYGKILALNNFRMFSIFVYLMFFFDSIVGVISAVVRLIVGILGSVFFLPRIGYSFLGRQLEKFDNGFKLSAGYYQMEAAHSNPVMITFCTLLYYNKLKQKHDEISDYDVVELIRQRVQKSKSVEPSEAAKTERLEVVARPVQPLKKDTAFTKNRSVSKSSFRKSPTSMSKTISATPKVYNRKWVNRWAVAVTLVNNIRLVECRKESSSFRQVVSF